MNEMGGGETLTDPAPISERPAGDRRRPKAFNTEAVKAIPKRIRELRPVASIACLIAVAFHPANPKLKIKKTTMKDVTKVVILQP